MSEERADDGSRQRDAGVPQRRARTLQRITAFTDGALAIALTLLALPLVNLGERSKAHESVADLIGRHLGDVLAFAVSFLVIALFWRTHRHLYEQLVDYDEFLLLLNTLWLMAVVFLPFPTARLFVESHLRADSAVLYLGNMLAISLLALAQTWWVVRRPQLRATSGPAPSRPLLPPVALALVFAVATLAAILSPATGLLLLVLVPVAQLAAARFARPAQR